ncbi:MAG: hypothetical protein CSA21_04605 [Deltaproteobacteria bacterium]|nr:MAG: hypothetical protein CSA21_04605 [Deltaproteobacteria bacterium]
MQIALPIMQTETSGLLDGTDYGNGLENQEASGFDTCFSHCLAREQSSRKTGSDSDETRQRMTHEETSHEENFSLDPEEARLEDSLGKGDSSDSRGDVSDGERELAKLLGMLYDLLAQEESGQDRAHRDGGINKQEGVPADLRRIAESALQLLSRKPSGEGVPRTQEMASAEQSFTLSEGRSRSDTWNAQVRHLVSLMEGLDEGEGWSNALAALKNHWSDTEQTSALSPTSLFTQGRGQDREYLEKDMHNGHIKDFHDTQGWKVLRDAIQATTVVETSSSASQEQGLQPNHLFVSQADAEGLGDVGSDQAEDEISLTAKEHLGQGLKGSRDHQGFWQDGEDAGHKDQSPLLQGEGKGQEVRETSSDLSFSRHLLEEDTSVRDGRSPRREMTRHVLDQLQQGAFRNLGQGRKQLTLHLNPAHLGSVHVVLQVKGKEVNAVLRTSQEEVTSILGDQMAQLKEQLERQGLRVNKLEVQNQMTSHDQSHQWNGGSEHNASREQLEAGMRELRWRTLQREGEVLAQDMHNPGHRVDISPHQGLDCFA